MYVQTLQKAMVESVSYENIYHDQVQKVQSIYSEVVSRQDISGERYIR